MDSVKVGNIIKAPDGSIQIVTDVDSRGNVSTRPATKEEKDGLTLTQKAKLDFQELMVQDSSQR